jgi:hypothetical protein
MRAASKPARRACPGVVAEGVVLGRHADPIAIQFAVAVGVVVNRKRIVAGRQIGYRELYPPLWAGATGTHGFVGKVSAESKTATITWPSALATPATRMVRSAA